jgi:hypothetical protein
MRFERLESRHLLAGLDVNSDGLITPIDALQVINWLNEPTEYRAELDVNGDGEIVPNDVLQVINHINRHTDEYFANMANDFDPPHPPGEITFYQKAVDDVFSLYSGETADIPVLDNDTANAGPTVILHKVGTVFDGTATANGRDIRYTAPADFVGETAITYSIIDGGKLDFAIVVINVLNRAPEGEDVQVTVNENSSNNAISLLDNVSDPEGHDLTVLSVGTASNGDVTLQGDTARYTPDEGFFGSDSFTYVVADSEGAEVTFTVDVTVDEVVLPAARTFTVRVHPAPIGSVEPAPDWSNPQITSAEFIDAVKLALNDYTKVADIDFNVVTSGPANWYIETAVVMAGGQHFRGQANASRVQIHSAWVPAGTHSCRDAPCNVGFVSPVFWTGGVPQLKKIMVHEFGHTSLVGWGHTSNTSCVMHSNASANFFCQSEINTLVNRYGRSTEPNGRLI